MTNICNKSCTKCNCTCTKEKCQEKCSNCRYCTIEDDHIKKSKIT